MCPREPCGALQGLGIPRGSPSWMRGCASENYSTPSLSRVCKTKWSWERVQRRFAPLYSNISSPPPRLVTPPEAPPEAVPKEMFSRREQAKPNARVNLA